jgi:hypothetical protein
MNQTRPFSGVVAVLALCVLGVGAQDVLYQDDFADLGAWGTPPGWRVAAGTLFVEGGGIRICSTGTDWQDLALEFDVTVGKLLAQWVIRAKDPAECCFIQLTSRDCPYAPNTLRYHRWRDGRMLDLKEDALPSDIVLGTSYHIRCEVVGSTVQTLIDGKVRGQWDLGVGYERGTIGFRASENETAAYRNLRVQRCAALTPLANTRKPAALRTPAVDPFLSPPFRAEWIWGPGEALDRAFRWTFAADAVLDARLWITCDNAFTLSVNGVPVGQGSDWYTPQVFDLTAHLRPGRNVLAVAAHNGAPGSAGVLAEGNVLLADGRNLAIVSGPAWRTSDAPAGDWESPAFDDGAWPAALALGRHPLAPWAGQADWSLPYLGPLELAEPLGLTVEAAPLAGRALKVTLRLRLAKPFDQIHPVRLTVSSPGAVEASLASGYPDAVGGRGIAGENTLTLTLPLTAGVSLPAGQYAVRAELVGVRWSAGAERAQGVLNWTPPTAAAVLPLAQRPMAPGLFTDQYGAAHRYRLEGDALLYDGERLLPLDHGDGAYWVLDDAGSRAALEACRSLRVLERVRRQGLTEEPVRLRLLDSIQCADAASEAAHEFSEDDGYGGRSRLLAVGGTTFRVTDNRRKLSYFAYTLRCRTPGTPHVLVFETPNDRERYTLVRVQPPWRNIGSGPYTGRDQACDGKPYQAGFVFYPEAEEIRLTVSRLPCEMTVEPESGGAVSRLWLFEIADDLAARPAEIAPLPGPTRDIGLAVTHPGYLYELYGRRGESQTNRLAALNSFADYCGFVGLNRLEFNAVNGADTSETAYYASAIWNRYRGDVDLFAEFLPLAAARGLAVVPCLTALALDIERFTDAPWISPLTFQIDKDGFSRRDFFAGRGNPNTLPDPLRPEVQKVFLDTLREFGERCQGSPAVKGLAFRLNGKIGTCYVGYDEQAQAATAGFSPWNLAEFQQETGIRLPDWDAGLTERWLAALRAGRRDDPAVAYIPTAYAWLRAKHWPEWTDWRCGRLTRFFLQARDLVRSFRPDWDLVIKCDMPSETPDRNIFWPAGRSALDLMRDHGFDPRQFAAAPGVILQQGYFIGGGEYFHHSGEGAYYQNPAAWGAFDYQPGLAELYRTPAGTSVEFYHTYWEEFGVARMGEFATDFWGAGTMFPAGRAFFRPLLHSLRVNNVQSMALLSWERGSAGHEGELRRFCRALRALPAVAPVAFEGTVVVSAGPAADAGLWVRRCGSRVALINESASARTVTVELPRADSALALYEYASQRQLVPPGAVAGPVTATVELDAYDLRVLGLE